MSLRKRGVSLAGEDPLGAAYDIVGGGMHPLEALTQLVDRRPHRVRSYAEVAKSRSTTRALQRKRLVLGAWESLRQRLPSHRRGLQTGGLLRGVQPPPAKGVPELEKHCWRARRLWIRSYLAGSVGSEPLSALRQYLTSSRA